MSSGYVTVPRCSVIFDEANYVEFALFMHIHMCGICLLDVLSGEVTCPPRLVPYVAPMPPLPPPTLAVDASDAERDTPRIAADDTTATYDQHVLEYSDALSVYRDDMTAYSQWCDNDARDAVVLS